MPKVCIIADTHKLHRSVSIPECDILIHCGDMCSGGLGDIENLKDIDEWFGSLPAKHIVCIAGNHDYPLEEDEFQFSNAHYLEDTSIELEGLKIFGSPWCPDLQGFAFYGSEMKLHQKWKSIPSDIDILVTHTPPAGILDMPSSGLVNLGCPMLREQIERISPQYHFFGHVHAGSGSQQRDGIHFINAAIVGGANFEVKNSAYILDID